MQLYAICTKSHCHHICIESTIKNPMRRGLYKSFAKKNGKNSLVEVKKNIDMTVSHQVYRPKEATCLFQFFLKFLRHALQYFDFGFPPVGTSRKQEKTTFLQGYLRNFFNSKVLFYR